jgi:hypothetical protein
MDEKLKKYFGESLETKEVKEYNYDLFSTVSDSVAYMLTKNKVTSFTNGAIIKYLADQTTLLSNFDSSVSVDYENSLESKSYRDFTFSIYYQMELRAKYLLQTDSYDNFNEMKEELYELMTPLMFESELRMPIIKKVIELSEKRLFSSNYNFIGPVLGHEQNDTTEVEDTEQYGITNLQSNQEDGDVDKPSSTLLEEVRTDCHDMLALKELILVLRKEKKIDKFSIALAFFNKYMKELDEEGFKTLVMTTRNGEVVNFQLNPYIGNEAEKNPHYGISKASTGIGILEAMSRFPNSASSLSDNEIVFVSTLGYVATKDNIDFKDMKKNIMDKASLCGELYCYEKNEKIVQGTRVCFTPLNYEDFPLILRNGSVIFGLFDNTFHSMGVVDNTLHSFLRNKFLDVYSDDWSFSEGWVSALYSHQDIEDEDMYFFYKKENEGLLIKILCSQYEEFPFSKELFSKSFGSEPVQISFKYAQETKPLHKRMNLENYVNSNSFDYSISDTWWELISRKYKGNISAERLKRAGLRNEVIRLIKDDGISLEEAIKKVTKV